MKLYNMPLSSYSAKVRIVIHEKDLDVELVDPPGGTDSEEYHSINPLGKVPALEVNGTVLPESEVINEYLEEEYPNPSLLPSSNLDRARVRFLSRFHDLYLQPPVSQILYELIYEESPDTSVIVQNEETIGEFLELLEDLTGDGPWLAGEKFTLADASFAPTFFYLHHFLPALGRDFTMDDYPELSTWWETVQKRPSAATVLEEMQEGLQAFG